MGLDRARSIVLVGFMAAGKTTIGRRLAARLRMPFLDTDDEIERIFGCSIAEIFSERGESTFRAAERDLICALLEGEPCVLSLGGGAFIDQHIRPTITIRATTIWLDPPFELIIDRLRRSRERPLASGRSAGELRRLWRARRQIYAEAHLHIEVSDADPAKEVERILHALQH